MPYKDMEKRREVRRNGDATLYDRTTFRTAKGNSVLLKEIATANGMSVNEYLVYLVKQDSGIDLMERKTDE